MGRGFFSGMFWGLMFSGVAGTTASLVHSNANKVQAPPEASALEVPAGSEFNQAKPEEEPVVPQTDTTKAPEVAPSQPVIVDADETADVTGVVPAQVPEVSVPDQTGGGAIVAPAAEDGADAVVVEAEEPVLPTPQVALPNAPATEAAPSADTSTDTAPDAGDATETMTAPATEEAAEAKVPDTQVAALPATETPQTPIAPAADAEPSVLPQTEPAAEVEAEAEPSALPQVEPEAEAEPTTLPQVEVAPPADENLETAPQVEAVPEAPDSIRVPVPEIRNLAPNVQTNRLPSIGGASDGAEAGEAVAQPEITEGAGDQGALAAHAMTFENPDAKPMMSVILIDNPDMPISDDALAHLPFALSFAIDASRNDAGDVAARYRAAGFEVLMLTNLPLGAEASDIEVAFEAYSRAIPEAVAVLEGGANGFLRGPSTATQIVGILADRGFGLITPSKGLNSAQKIAMREGVPAALVYRELDADNENPALIRRYLDRAAFRAAQEGSVIMLGHTRPETIEALVLWALEDRAASVAMAPVSAVLTGQ